MRCFITYDLSTKINTFATDVDTSTACMNIQYLLLLLTTEGTAISLLLLSSIFFTDQINTLITDVDASWACNDTLDLILILATERAVEHLAYFLRFHR